LGSPRWAAKPLHAGRDTRSLQVGHGPVQRRDAEDRRRPETYAVRADGELLVCEPASVLPMAQRYFLF
jgi:urease subunit alpha